MKRTKEIVMCDHCGMYPATRQDYRSNNGVVGKKLSCEWCLGLGDVTIREITDARYNDKVENIDPKTYYNKEVKNG